MDSHPDAQRDTGSRLTPSPGPRTDHRSGTEGEPDARTRILNAAEELFAHAGYDATATAGIAKAAGVPKGLVFHYFPRKIDLLATLIGERTGIEELREDHADTQPGDPVRMLSRLALRVPLHASPAMRTILFREAGTHRPARERLRHLNAELNRRARFALELALPGSRGDHARLEAAAATFTAVLLYQESLCQLTGQHIDAELVANLIAKALT
ncbi:TetR/AcrR family transcriptional regulator [Nonomuraea antimicrobica]